MSDVVCAGSCWLENIECDDHTHKAISIEDIRQAANSRTKAEICSIEVVILLSTQTVSVLLSDMEQILWDDTFQRIRFRYSIYV